MSGEPDINTLLRSMTPKLNGGDYVFCTIKNLADIDIQQTISIFKEEEGWTVILAKDLANQSGLSYSYVAAWITLTIHSSLEAVGLTAAFANALAKEGISCNVVAAFYHDHIFVAKKDAEKAMEALKRLSEI
ncbi:MAG: ACT domain-containing protein [Bacteroidota bacterium]|nr:ACT domain-containing protein [Bacteroidota bacterium]